MAPSNRTRKRGVSYSAREPPGTLPESSRSILGDAVNWLATIAARLTETSHRTNDFKKCLYGMHQLRLSNPRGTRAKRRRRDSSRTSDSENAAADFASTWAR